MTSRLEFLDLAHSVLPAGFCFISFIWVLWCVPEVKGVPLEQLDAIFGDNSGEEDLKRINRIRKRLLEQHAAGAPLSAAQ